MPLKSTIDALLHKACASGDVPGVVALAADRNGTIYEGAFGVRERDFERYIIAPDLIKRPAAASPVAVKQPHATRKPKPQRT